MAETRTSRVNLAEFRKHWADIAQELVLTYVPTEDGGTPIVTLAEVCATYGMTRTECEALLKIPEFTKLVRDMKTRVDNLGDNASIMIRAQGLYAGLCEDLYTAAKGSSDLKEKRETCKLLAQVGGLLQNQPIQRTTNGGNANNAPTVIINVPRGIPNMEHIYAIQEHVSDVD